jgi:anti-sigma regulatory factor (Ser/Thr protein kinase)
MNGSATASGMFARRIDALADVFRLIERFVAPIDGGRRALAPLETAMEEIFANMVEHNAGGAGEIAIDARLADGEIVVRITDFDSSRFDVTADAPAVDTAAPLAERTPGGLGLHLVRKLVDRVEYDYRDGASTITLHKRMD